MIRFVFCVWLGGQWKSLVDLKTNGHKNTLENNNSHPSIHQVHPMYIHIGSSYERQLREVVIKRLLET